MDRETLVASVRPLRPGGMAEVVRLAGPAVAASASQVVMNFTDSLMVAGVGSGAVGAVTGASMFFLVLTCALGGLLSAVVPFASQAYGRGEPREAARYSWQAIWISLAFGSFGFLLVPLLPAFFRAVGHAPAVQHMEVAFATFMCYALVFSLLRWTLQGFFQAIGRTKLIMVISVSTSALNILLNALLIYGLAGLPKMGVAGSGLATLISTVAAVILFFGAYLWGRAACEHGTRTELKPSLSRLKDLARVGLPTSFQWSLDVAVWAVWHNLLVGRLGPEPFDANAAAVSITELAWLPVLGLGQSACSLVGWYIGRRRLDCLRRSVRNCMALSACYMLAMALVMVLLGRQLIDFFFQFQPLDSGGPESRERVLMLGVVVLRIAATFQIFDGWNITLMGALRGGRDTLWPAVAQQLLAWLFFAPLAWLLCYPLDLGLAGTWWASAAYVTLLCAALYWRYRRAAWLRPEAFGGAAGAQMP